MRPHLCTQAGGEVVSRSPGRQSQPSRDAEAILQGGPHNGEDASRKHVTPLDSTKQAAAAAAEELPCCGGAPLLGAADAGLEPAPLPDEHERVAALMALGMVGADPEPRFDAITKLMAAIFEPPVAAITLVGEDTILFHSRAGQWACQAPRRGTFCEWLVSSGAPKMLIVEDALADSHFMHNRYVAGAPGICFYAGCPLVGSGGHTYGALCTCKWAPRWRPSDAARPSPWPCAAGLTTAPCSRCASSPRARRRSWGAPRCRRWRCLRASRVTGRARRGPPRAWRAAPSWSQSWERRRARRWRRL
jgi:hypothetical protein